MSMASLPRDPRDGAELSPMGDRRERVVRCKRGCGRETLNYSAVCDGCQTTTDEEMVR